MLKLISLIAALFCAFCHFVAASDLMTCGAEAIRGWKLNGTNLTLQWTWTATNSNLPDSAKPWFATTDECKPSPAGRVLVTSSGGDSYEGGVALVEPATSNVVFYARVTNAHSAALLPGNRVVVAESEGALGGPGRLIVFDLDQSNVELFSLSLEPPRGLVWDEERQRLWVLTSAFLLSYSLQDWNTSPQFGSLSADPLPGDNGHDLAAVPNSADLILSTDLNCWLFDRNTRRFRPHPELGMVTNVKNLSVHPASGQVCYVKGEIQYWSERLRFVAPSNMIQVPGEHFYKARWNPPDLPKLSLTRTTTNLLLSWPSWATDFLLEETTNLNSGTWLPTGGAISDNTTNRTLTITPSVNDRHFRLHWIDP